jgi:hypothetical protein
MLNVFNNISQSLKFTTEEVNNIIIFLDITIKKHNNQFQRTIYRKPTATECTIP